jgi:hypothetical protein
MESYIMFIPGITINDILLMQQKLNNINIINNNINNININTDNNIENKSTNKHGEQLFAFEKIPKKFISLATDWPLTTNLKCSMCTLSITHQPFPISTLFEKENGVDVFTVLPNVTCNALCCALYIRKYLKNDSAYKYILKKITSVFYNINALYEIPEAIHHTNLQIYGGDMSTSEFINNNKKIMNNYIKLITTTTQ